MIVLSSGVVSRSRRRATHLTPSLPTHTTLTGSWLTAAGHLITAIIGAGVLGLPNAVAWLGWAAGIACMVG